MPPAFQNPRALRIGIGGDDKDAIDLGMSGFEQQRDVENDKCRLRVIGKKGAPVLGDEGVNDRLEP